MGPLLQPLHSPQSVALVLWSFATLQYNPLQGELLEVAQQRAIRMQDELSTIDVSNIFWSHAQLNVRFHFTTLTVRSNPKS